MNDNTQDNVQTSELRQRLYNDLPEEHDTTFDAAMHAMMDTLKRSLVAAPDDVTKLKNPFIDEATGVAYRPYAAVATQIYPDAAFVDEREQKIKNLEDEVAGLNYHLAEAKDRLQSVEDVNRTLQMRYVDLQKKIELLEAMLHI